MYVIDHITDISGLYSSLYVMQIGTTPQLNK